jgi:hypothetical protein
MDGKEICWQEKELKTGDFSANLSPSKEKELPETGNS